MGVSGLRVPGIGDMGKPMDDEERQKELLKIQRALDKKLKPVNLSAAKRNRAKQKASKGSSGNLKKSLKKHFPTAKAPFIFLISVLTVVFFWKLDPMMRWVVDTFGADYEPERSVPSVEVLQLRETRALKKEVKALREDLKKEEGKSSSTPPP